MSTSGGTPGRPDGGADRDTVAARLRRNPTQLLLGSVLMMGVFTILIYANGVSRLWLLVAAFAVGAIAMTARSTVGGSVGAILRDAFALLMSRGPDTEARGEGPPAAGT